MHPLPMIEHNDCAWNSTSPGLMQGCGHDGHMVMLVGADRYLAKTRRFDGTAAPIYQPGEEGLAGAKALIEDGLFERSPVFSVLAMHSCSDMRPGTVGVNPPVQAHFAAEVAQRLVGRDHVDLDMDPRMGAEDLSFMLQAGSGAYLRLGQGVENGMGSCVLHNSRCDFDDEILPLGAALHASLIEHGLPLSADV
jgi:metal-dependent amidase/aminoacylase/carboxypeptidase family protein